MATDLIQALQDDFDRLTRATAKFRASLTNMTARAADVVLPPGFVDVKQLRETLEIIDLEVGRAEKRLGDAMFEAGVFKGRVTLRRY